MMLWMDDICIVRLVNHQIIRTHKDLTNNTLTVSLFSAIERQMYSGSLILAMCSRMCAGVPPLVSSADRFDGLCRLGRCSSRSLRYVIAITTTTKTPRPSWVAVAGESSACFTPILEPHLQVPAGFDSSLRFLLLLWAAVGWWCRSDRFREEGAMYTSSYVSAGSRTPR